MSKGEAVDRAIESDLVADPVARWLRFGVAAFLFVLVLAMFPYTPSPAEDIKTLLYNWAGFVLASFWLMGTWVTRRPGLRPRLLTALLAALIVLFFAAAARSPYTGHSMVEVRKFFSLFLLYLVAAYAYHRPEHLQRFAATVCVAVALASCYGFSQRLGFDPFPWKDRSIEQYMNLPATFGNPNFAAHVLAPAIILAAYLTSVKGTRWCGVFLPVFLAHLYLTRCRSGVIALGAAAALVIIAWAVARAKKSTPAKAAVALALVIVLGIGGIGGGAAMSKIKTGRAVPLDTSLLLRYNAYYSACRMIAERPVLGYGPGNYVIENPRFWTPYEQEWFAKQRQRNAHVHNDLFELACEAGMAAAGLYLACLILAVHRGLGLAFGAADGATRRAGLALAAFFLAFLVDGAFGFNLRVPVSAVLLFILFGALDGLTRPPDSAKTGKRSLKGLVWRLTVIALALVSVVFDTRVFAAEFLLQRARGAASHKNDAAALRLAERGERLAPWNGLFGFEAGAAALKQNDYDAAIAHFERALERNPNAVSVAMSLARAEFNLSAYASGPAAQAHLERAVDYAQDALDICAVLPEAHGLMGRAALSEARALEARDAPRNAVQEVWRQADEYLVRAVSYGAEEPSELMALAAFARMQSGDRQGARNALARAARFSPVDGKAWTVFDGFARAYNEYGPFRTALLREIRQLERNRRENATRLATAYLWLAKVHDEGIDDAPSAAQAYRNAAQTAPGRSDIWSAFVEFARRTGDVESLRAAVLEATKSPTAAVPAAVEALAAAFARGPEAFLKASAGFAVAAQQAAGRGTEAALRELRPVGRLLLDLATENGSAAERQGETLLNLGVALASIEAYPDADRALTEAAQRFSSPQARATCAMYHAETLSRMERYAEAERLLREAVRLAPADLEVRMAYAQALANTGKAGEARLEYELLLHSYRLDPRSRQRIEAAIEALGEGS